MRPGKRHGVLWLLLAASSLVLATTSHTSVEQGLGDQDAPSVCKVGCGECEKVYLHNAEFRHDVVDVAIPGRGLIHMIFSRTYRSLLPAKTSPATNDLGEGWVHRFEEHLIPDSTGVRRFGPHGRDDYWLADGSDYISPQGQFGTLVGNDSTGWTLRFPDGTKHTYDPDGFLNGIEDRFGNALSIVRTGKNHIDKIVDAYHREYDFNYQYVDAGNNYYRLVGITDFAGREVVYGYNPENGLLTDVTTPTVTGTSNNCNFPSGRTMEYEYFTESEDAELTTNLIRIYRPQEVEDSGDAYLTVTYGTSGSTYDKVTSFTRGGTNSSGVAAGGTTTLEYFLLNQSEPAGQPNLPRMRVEIEARNGNVRHYFGNEYGQHIMTREYTKGLRAGEPTYYETVSEFNADGLLRSREFPLGNKIEMDYDSLGVRAAQANVLEVRRIADATRGGGEDIVTEYTYEPLFQQVHTIVESRGTAAGFTPPLGSASAARYTTTLYYDYMEGNADVPDTAWVTVPGSLRNLGDKNSDGVTNQVDGNLVRRDDPDVTLRAGSEMATHLSSTTQTIYTELVWDGDHLTKIIDPGGNVTKLEYYEDRDPDGDGTNVPGQSSTAEGGYLKERIADNETSSRQIQTGSSLQLITSYEYNELGDVTSITNPRGVRTDFEVTDLHEVAVVTRGADVSAAATAGELVTGESAFTYEIRYCYDHNGRVIGIETEQSHDTVGVGTWVEQTMTYDILGNLVQLEEEVDASTSVVTKYRYDPEQLLQLVISPETTQVYTYYDERNLPWKVVRGYGTADSSVVEFAYDDNGNRVSILDAEDTDGDTYREETTIEYDGFDRPVKTVDPMGNYALTAYDIASQPILVEVYGHKANDPGGTLTLLKKTYFRHDELSRVYQTDDSLFVATGFSPSRTVDLRDDNSDNLVTSYVEYDALSRVQFAVDDDGTVVENTFDSASRLVETEDELGNRILRDYDANSNLIELQTEEVSPESHVSDEDYFTYYTYDQLDRLVRTVDNIGQARYLAYDARDNLIETQDAIGTLGSDPWSVYTGGNINTNGNTTTYVYDGLGRRILEWYDLRTDGSGANALDTTNVFNSDGRIKLAFEFDKSSRLVKFIDDNGNETAYGYDALDRQIGQTNDDGESIDLTYDRDDNVSMRIDPNGSIVTYTFDALNRVTEVDVSREEGVLGTTRETYEDDGLSRLTTSVDNNGDSSNMFTVEYFYDSLGRVLEEQQNNEPVSRVFEGDGRRVSMRSPTHATITYTHDAIDRVKTISDGGVRPVVDLDYIGMGYRELRRDYESRAYRKRYGTGDFYDGLKRIEQETVHKLNGTFVLHRYYSYNRENQCTSEQRMKDSELTDSYTYDSLQRLEVAEYDDDGTFSAVERVTRQLDFALDGVGNRREIVPYNSGGPIATISYAVNEMNEYTSFGGISLSHSKNGNQKESKEQLFSYDYKNRLVLVKNKASSDTVALYFYDAGNRRTKKEVHDGGSWDYTLVFYYDGWQVVEEHNESGDALSYYVWHGAAYIDELVKFERTSDHDLGARELSVHQNQRKDVIGLAKPGGVVIEALVYDAFGKPYDATTKTHVLLETDEGCPYLFQGRRLDPETGLYYFRNRMYDMVTGRFLQRDPVWDPANVGNQYTFGSSAPVSRHDPYGMCGCGCNPPPKRVGRRFLGPNTYGGSCGGDFSLYSDSYHYSTGLWRPVNVRMTHGELNAHIASPKVDHAGNAVGFPVPDLPPSPPSRPSGTQSIVLRVYDFGVHPDASSFLCAEADWPQESLEGLPLIVSPVSSRNNLITTAIDVCGDSYKIKRLEVISHGSPGSVGLGNGGLQGCYCGDMIETDADGNQTGRGRHLDRVLREQHIVEFAQYISPLLAEDSVIIFLGCASGSGKLGRDFLQALANETRATCVGYAQRGFDVQPRANAPLTFSVNPYASNKLLDRLKPHGDPDHTPHNYVGRQKAVVAIPE